MLDSVIARDFNEDGVLDLAVVNSTDQSGEVGAPQFGEVTVLLGAGDGSFLPAAGRGQSVHTGPVLADLNGDGVPDLLTLRQDGRILFRPGRAGPPGVFDSPIVVNPQAAGDFPALDFTVLSDDGRPVIAAIDAGDSAVSFYSYDPARGAFTRTPGPRIPGILPVRIVAGDLNGDGRDDLVVAASASDQVFVYLQNAAGGFGPLPSYSVGVGVDPTDVELADVNGDGRPDIVVANQSSGDVSVLLNDPNRPFSTEQRFARTPGRTAWGRPRRRPSSPTRGLPSSWPAPSAGARVRTWSPSTAARTRRRCCSATASAEYLTPNPA